GLFWPRGAQIRAESLRAWNPFELLPDCDRLLALSAVPSLTQQVSLSSPRWFEELASRLVQYGTLDLVGSIEDPARMAAALVRLAVEPIDSEALLIHARITGARREQDHIVAELELPEALQ